MNEVDDLERDVDAAISSCGGNPRAALRALIITVSFLSAELKAAKRAASKGYVRARTKKAS